MSATFDEEHLNRSTSFLQPLGTLRSSSPQLVRFGEMARSPKINQQQVIVRLRCLAFYNCSKDLVMYRWNQKHLESLLGTLAQEARSQPVSGLWSCSNMLTTVTEKNLNSIA